MYLHFDLRRNTALSVHDEQCKYIVCAKFKQLCYGPGRRVLRPGHAHLRPSRRAPTARAAASGAGSSGLPVLGSLKNLSQNDAA